MPGDEGGRVGAQPEDGGGDLLPAGLRWFADNQPFTPITDTLRGLLGDERVGSSATMAVAWCLAITAAAFLWAAYLYNRRPGN